MDETDFDLAFEKTEFEREEAIRRILSQLPDEGPALDEDGNRLCVDCEELIPFKRLALVPQAVRCVECQAIAERPW